MKSCDRTDRTTSMIVVEMFSLYIAFNTGSFQVHRTPQFILKDDSSGAETVVGSKFGGILSISSQWGKPMVKLFAEPMIQRLLTLDEISHGSVYPGDD